MPLPLAALAPAVQSIAQVGVESSWLNNNRYLNRNFDSSVTVYSPPQETVLSQVVSYGFQELAKRAGLPEQLVAPIVGTVYQVVGPQVETLADALRFKVQEGRKDAVRNYSAPVVRHSAKKPPVSSLTHYLFSRPRIGSSKWRSTLERERRRRSKARRRRSLLA